MSQHRSRGACHGNRQGDIGSPLSSDEGTFWKVSCVLRPRLIAWLPRTKGFKTIEARYEVVVSPNVPTLPRREETEVEIGPEVACVQLSAVK